MSWLSTSSPRPCSGRAESSSSRSMTARVPCAVTRLRKISRTSRLPLGADAVHRGLGVLGEGPCDPADLLVRLAGEELLLPVALLPEPRHREGQERQGAPRALDRRDHLVHERSSSKR